jgi:hypothetical protein
VVGYNKPLSLYVSCDDLASLVLPRDSVTKNSAASQVPDSMMAAEKYPREEGLTKCQQTLDGKGKSCEISSLCIARTQGLDFSFPRYLNAPADSPKMATRLGSPPKAAMLLHMAGNQVWDTVEAYTVRTDEQTQVLCFGPARRSCLWCCSLASAAKPSLVTYMWTCDH